MPEETKDLKETAAPKCDHRFVLESKHYERESNGYMADYRSLAVYFCEKCLMKQDVTRSEWARETPLWWKH